MPLRATGRSIALLREAAAQGNAEAYYELYEHHNSWDRGDLDKVPLVPRAEADRALHKAAELGHPFSTQMLARLLDRGTTVKRDPVAARYWAERAARQPCKGHEQRRPPGVPRPPAGELGQAGGARPRSRNARTVECARPTISSAPGRELALAIRKDDPVRARKLLEEARRPDPGGATPPLAEMLIAGEGGPADPKRALSLLKAPSDTVGVKGVLGQLYLEGKLVPRDIQEAVNLIDMAGSWDLDARHAGAAVARRHIRKRGSPIPSRRSITRSRPRNSTNPAP